MKLSKKEQGKSVESYMRYYGSKKHDDIEIEKTPRDMEILQFATDAASEVMHKYGRKKDTEVLADHIHIVPVGGTETVTKGGLLEAAQSSTRASFIIDRDPSDIQFCLRAFHEILHLKSYKALQIITPLEEKACPYLNTYRSGFGVASRDGKEKYFTNLEEGIVGLLTERFFEEKIKTSETFKQELEERGDISFDISRQEEIQQLHDLVDQIWKKNKDQFSNKDKVLDLFIQTQVNGDLLPVGKLIEKTFGKGSFREIGEGKFPEYHED